MARHQEESKEFLVLFASVASRWIKSREGVVVVENGLGRPQA